MIPEKNIQFIVKPGGRLTGLLRVPGDKSISHRSIMFGALAEGVTQVSGFLSGEDNLATLNAFRSMGVAISDPKNGYLEIKGVGMHGLQAPAEAIDLGNSGTSIRLLSGLIAGAISDKDFDVVLTGDSSLSMRPMKRVTDPLKLMGAEIETNTAGTPPITLYAGQKLTGKDYVMPMASAQVKSCLLLAGLYAQGKTCVTEPAPTRDHTERMLRGFGYKVESINGTICLQGGGKLSATEIDIPADISSATFFMVGATIAEGSELILEHVGINPTRTGVINILRLMGASIEILNQRDIGGEPVADIRVKSAKLKGIHIPEDQVPLAIDEFPAIFIAASCAEGETVLTGAKELRVKESDRIQAMADGLTVLGIKAEARPDGIRIQGGQLGAGCVESHGDHRIAMSFAMAALVANGEISISDCANVNTSFPSFLDLANQAGLSINIE
ncbi:3-phosphoshikimate 1-carboxyvinyltransferase [Beggiatoa alba]|nr:3-phosphoshikimate 1-carboxyvinyltransferase [Beggiatoa alba]